MSVNVIQILQLLLSRPWSVGHRGQVGDQAVRQVMARATGAGSRRDSLASQAGAYGRVPPQAERPPHRPALRERTPDCDSL